MEFVQQNWMWVTLAIISGSMLLWPLLKGGGSQALTPSQATRMMNRENAVVIDVRESGEWNTGHIAGARHIAMPLLQQKMAELEKFKNRPLIICCASGARSSAACSTLRKAGFEKVFNLAGGMTSWREAKLPVTTK
ncbi:sulfurtransferase [Rugosibacter aromaticivorans]|uniref:Sulfurtransferase n=1 Tax=Rugosibacter aromaticivorans TaxID=1565605 RepID=A0A0C5JJQ0_9PROT|nr:rhodanese-like domain-containing protein [Rugosibacter aromaticivorans]AJP47546.1 sulfurtransferase [Rugosibacter aromaticivorans]TBR13439.1 MAG: rhodanese-like domain-containing protein [Rugosibacter sp.]